MAKRYSLVIEDYKGKSQIVPFVFDGKKEEKSSLEFIDYVTSRYTSKYELFDSIKSNENIKIDPDKVYLTYRYNGLNLRTNIILNNYVIHEISEKLYKN